jgi:hypothetical protein
MAALVLGERAGVDDGTGEVREVGRVADRQRVHGLGREVGTHPGPQRGRDVGARGRRALLPGELEGTTDQRRAQHVGVGRRVRDDEVLAAGLADEPRISAVRRQVGAHGRPQLLEGRGGAGEVDARQIGVRQHDLGDRETVAGEHIDHARRHAGLLEQLHGQRGGELLGGEGFQTTVLPISAGAVGRLPRWR